MLRTSIDTCPCGKEIDGNRHVCKACWNVAPAALKTNYVFWQSKPDSPLARRAINALTDYCGTYAKEREYYNAEGAPDLVSKLSSEEQIHLDRILERRIHLRARLNAAPDYSPYDQAEARALEWVIRKLETLVSRLDRPTPPPVNNHQPPAKPFTAPASIEEGERLHDELTGARKLMVEQNRQPQLQEINAQLRELKAWLHAQRRQQQMQRKLQQAKQTNLLASQAFKLLSEAIAADGEEALIALYDDAKGIRIAFHQMAVEFYAQAAAKD